jgi:hypothetical protein
LVEANRLLTEQVAELTPQRRELTEQVTPRIEQHARDAITEATTAAQQGSP